MAASYTLDLKPDSPLTKRIRDAVTQRVRASRAAYAGRHAVWKQAEEQVLAYLPEKDADAVRRLQRDQGGTPDYTTMKIPYSYGVLMASHTYWTTVFLSRQPVHQFTGRHGETQQQIQAMEALIDYQNMVGGHLIPLYVWLFDAGRYGLGIVHIDWVEEKSKISEIIEVPETLFGMIPLGKTKRQKATRTIRGYQGNKLSNVRPYDFLPDPRYPAWEFQKGEFCAVRLDVGWNQLYKMADAGYLDKRAVMMARRKAGSDRGVKEESPDMRAQDYPTADTFSLDAGTRGMNTTSLRNIMLSVIECTIELSPHEWGLGASSYPEKWLFTVTEDFSIVLGAAPLGKNHDKFEFAVLEYEPEGYALAPRGIPEVLKPINDTIDWLVNSHLFNVRAALNNNFIVNPIKVEIEDLENPLPGGVIRLAPAAYYTEENLDNIVKQVPVGDVTGAHLTDMQTMLGLGQRTVGISDQVMGLVPPTGRRSATEVRTGAGFGVNRLKTTSEFFSAMGFSPFSQMMVQNSQQFYEGEQKYRIVGQLAQEAGAEFMNVTQDDILGFYDFVPVDGTMPIDRLAQANLWQQILSQIQVNPVISQKYDMGRIFEWIAQLAGLKNIQQFRIDLIPDEEAAIQAQAGNIIPLPGANAGRPGAPPGSPTPTQTTSGGPSNVSQAIQTGG